MLLPDPGNGCYEYTNSQMKRVTLFFKKKTDFFSKNR